MATVAYIAYPVLIAKLKGLEARIKELEAEVARAGLSEDDREQIAQGIEHFIMAEWADGVDAIWQPYVDKLRRK